jgi:hypothetical protein
VSQSLLVKAQLRAYAMGIIHMKVQVGIEL